MLDPCRWWSCNPLPAELRNKIHQFGWGHGEYDRTITAMVWVAQRGCRDRRIQHITHGIAVGNKCRPVLSLSVYHLDKVH
jgi:hypothetical protein